jgi:hypothetical protein
VWSEDVSLIELGSNGGLLWTRWWSTRFLDRLSNYKHARTVWLNCVLVSRRRVAPRAATDAGRKKRSDAWVFAEGVQVRKGPNHLRARVTASAKPWSENSVKPQRSYHVSRQVRSQAAVGHDARTAPQVYVALSRSLKVRAYWCCHYMDQTTSPVRGTSKASVILVSIKEQS